MPVLSPVRTAVVGAGMISDIYLKNMTRRFPSLEVSAICSAHGASAELRAAAYGLAARSLDEILADERIELIVNLTPAPAHEDIIRRALLSGKHVYTEKTMTLSHETAIELSALAEQRGLRLGSAPDTFMGASLQNARRAIDEGLIGTVTGFACASNRCDAHLRSFYRFLNLPGGGVGYDYAVYYLTALVSLLGPVARTAAVVRAPYPQHLDIDPSSPTYGSMIDTPGESEISAVLQLSSGVSGTVLFNNNSNRRDEAFFAIYGTKGILYLPDPNRFGEPVCYLPGGVDREDAQARIPVDYDFGFRENSRGIGPADLAIALRTDRPHRASAQLACHVLETIDGIIASGERGAFVEIGSTCQQPAPLKTVVGSEEDALL